MEGALKVLEPLAAVMFIALVILFFFIIPREGKRR